MHLLRLFFALLFGLLLGSPAWAAKDPIRVVPVGIEDVRLGLGSASFGLVVQAERLKGLPVRLRSLEYEIEVARTRVSQSRTDYDGIKLKKGHPIKIVVPIELNAAEALSLAARGLQGGEDLQLRIRGAAKVRVLIFPLRLPFKAELLGGGP